MLKPLVKHKDLESVMSSDYTEVYDLKSYLVKRGHEIYYYGI